ncbi:hypothetical protein FSARC_12052 [Fusarium sarcochroum]|uniref:NACHT domain-containing protein n=1 Tax=Fusarium sarcochroum TaxID=1208366 RepID=A0A8H4TBI5_9HYPO|nr:hypothetical protein FSARC_12052 [Fusarium sarcochroum]
MMNSDPQVPGVWEHPETPTGHPSYTAHDRVSQYNAPAGSQNISKGSGNQFPGATFQAPVYFAFPEMNSRSNDIDDAANGTCEWLLRHEIFTSWASCDHGRGLLWIKGKPGSGKSTLLRHVLGDVMRIPDIGEGALVLSFFFHGRGSELQKTPLGLFQSLFHQLLRQVPGPLMDFVHTFQQRCETIGNSGGKWQWHPRELPRFLRSSLPKVLETHQVWLFIDALDECGQEKAIELVREFKSLLEGLSSTSSHFRICFTCRQYPILDPACPFEICLEDANRRDISTYVRSQLSASRMLRESTIPSLITKRAEGVFMWARLVVEKALRLDNDGEALKRIEEAIYDVPPDLDELYLGLVRSMDRRSTSLKLMQWVCFATRPLSLDELRWAMLVDPDCPQRLLYECQVGDYPSDHDGMTRRVQTLSCGLVEVTSPVLWRLSCREECIGSGRVQFIHQSVKDFFVEKGLSALGGSLSTHLSTVLWLAAVVFLHYFPWKLLSRHAFQSPAVFAMSAFWQNGVLTGAGKSNLVVGIAHHRLSRICLSYLTMEEIGRSRSYEPAHLKTSFPFLHYATTSWVVHMKQSHASGVLQEDILEYFAGPSNTLVERWVHNYRILEKYSRDCPSHQTSLIHVVSRYGVAGALWAFLVRADQAGTDIDGVDLSGRTPLSWAAERGHEAIINLLLDWGASTEAPGMKRRQTPLFYAIWSGREAIVRLLLDRGANIEAQDKTLGRTPLCCAAWSGHKAIIELLLDRDADTETVYIDGRSLVWWAAEREVFLDGRPPLWWAVEKGYEAIFKLLLDRGAYTEIADMEGRTLIWWAAEKGREAVVELLLDAGADIETADAEGRTPLWWAAERGHEAVVKLLLGRDGISVNTQDKYGWTPLSWALFHEREAMFQLLLSKDSTVEVKDNNGQALLLWAAENGHDVVVEALLEKGASLESRDKDGRTPLLLAVMNRREAVMKQLLEKGADIEAKSNYGITPLFWARVFEHDVIVQQLIDRAATLG